MQSHRVDVTVLSKAALEPSMPVSVALVMSCQLSVVTRLSPLHHTVPALSEEPVYVRAGHAGSVCGLQVGGDALIFSSSSSILSCCRRSFAHLANSSWLLVAFRSRLTLR